MSAVCVVVGAVVGGVEGAVVGGVEGAVVGGVEGAVVGAVEGAVVGAVVGAVEGAVAGGVEGAGAESVEPASLAGLLPVPASEPEAGADPVLLAPVSVAAPLSLGAAPLSLGAAPASLSPEGAVVGAGSPEGAPVGAPEGAGSLLGAGSAAFAGPEGSLPCAWLGAEGACSVPGVNGSLPRSGAEVVGPSAAPEQPVRANIAHAIAPTVIRSFMLRHLLFDVRARNPVTGRFPRETPRFAAKFTNYLSRRHHDDVHTEWLRHVRAYMRSRRNSHALYARHPDVRTRAQTQSRRSMTPTYIGHWSLD